MPVIDSDGVVGQVTAVGPFTSEATLLTENDQSVPVMLTRNGLRAIAVGSGKDGSIDVPFMPAAADIQNGDVFVTWVRWNPWPSGNIDAPVSRSTNGGVSYTPVTNAMTNKVNPRDNTATSSCGRPSLKGKMR